MKTKLIILALASLALSGCVSSNSVKKLQEFERLGIVEAQITGKFSNTQYQVVEQDGQRIAVLVHSNAWIPQLKIVRRTPVKSDSPNP